MTSSNLSYLMGNKIKMEPLSPSTVSRAGRKRNASQASVSSTTSVDRSGSKKLKKYQLDPSFDPTVRNAIAAKANREKKKREEQELKTANAALKEQNQILEKQLREVLEEREKLIQQLNELKKISGERDLKSPEEFIKQLSNDVDPDLVELPLKPEDTFSEIKTDTDPFANSDFNFSPTLKFEDLGLDSEFNFGDTTSPASLDEQAYSLSPQGNENFEFNVTEDPLLPSLPKDYSLPRDLFGEYSNNDHLQSK